MKILTINYQKTFNLGNFSSHRIGVEVDVEEDNVEDAMAEAKLLVEKFHAESIQPTIPQFDTSTNPYNGQTGTQEKVIMDMSSATIGMNVMAPTSRPTLLTKEQKQAAQIQNYIEVIKIAKSEKALSLYKAMVERESNTELTEAYQSKLEELKKQTV